MHAVSEWRKLLGEIIKNPEEKKRLAQVLNVSGITLMRWARGEFSPRHHKLQLLLDAFPQDRVRLLRALQAEFSTFVPVQENDARKAPLQGDISLEFYTRFFKEYVTLNKLQRPWHLRNMILHQALKHLDPNEQGLAIAVNQCTKPAEGKKVRTARISMGVATPPWPRQVDMSALFLAGAESLVGYVIRTGRTVVVQSRGHQGTIPVHWVDGEESVAAFPLLFSGRIAGCVTCSSTQPHYFNDASLELIQKYADLIVLTIEHDEFYTFEDFDLRFLPDYRLQLQHISSMHQLVIDEMQQASRNDSPITSDEAEHRAWRGFEERILRSAESGTKRCAHATVGQKVDQNHDR